MEDNTKLIELLLERATDYGKTSFELIRLKTIDKTADVVSSLIPQSVVLILMASFLFFLNMGIALWLGDMLGKEFYGFFVVAAFYIIAGILIHFFLHKRIKRIIGNYFIKNVLK
jgi:hypothetical protein